ncbi:hypothetical protein Tco_0434097, partial [Tanacetum coccineum]
SHLDITSDHKPGSAGNTSITPDSVHAGEPHIIKKIVNFNEEELKTKKGLRSFLGILNYALKYIGYHNTSLGLMFGQIV